MSFVGAGVGVGERGLESPELFVECAVGDGIGAGAGGGGAACGVCAFAGAVTDGAAGARDGVGAEASAGNVGGSLAEAAAPDASS